GPPAAAAPEAPEPGKGAVQPSKNAAGGEFGSLERSDKGEIEQRVWEHAEESGFERKAAPVETLGAAGTTATLASGSQTPPQNPKAPPAPTKSEQLSVLSFKVLGFFSTFLLIQLAVESLALAVPQMTDPLKNGFIALAGL